MPPGAFSWPWGQSRFQSRGRGNRAAHMRASARMVARSTQQVGRLGDQIPRVFPGPTRPAGSDCVLRAVKIHPQDSSYVALSNPALAKTQPQVLVLTTGAGKSFGHSPAFMRPVVHVPKFGDLGPEPFRPAVPPVNLKSLLGGVVPVGTPSARAARRPLPAPLTGAGTVEREASDEWQVTSDQWDGVHAPRFAFPLITLHSSLITRP